MTTIASNTVEQFYTAVQADYEGVYARLRTNERIAKFVGIFADDASYATLRDALEAQQWEEAFRAAHTLKGVARDMGFNELSDCASDVTEALRVNHNDEAQSLMPALTHEYQRVHSIIEQFAE